MSDALVSLFFGAGVGAFVYSRMSRRTGSGNEQPLVVITLVTGVLAFAFFYTLLAFVLNIN